MNRKNPEYIKHVKSLGCCICGQEGTAHHVRKGVPEPYRGGMGMKPHDLMTICLCAAHHDQAHRNPAKLPIDVKNEIISCLCSFIEGMLDVKGRKLWTN